MSTDARPRRRVHARWLRTRIPFASAGSAGARSGADAPRRSLDDTRVEQLDTTRVRGIDHDFIAVLRSMAAQAHRRHTAN